MLQELRKKCIREAKKAVAESVNEDNLIVQAITNLEELENVFNTLVMRVREWYSLYFPEISKQIRDNEAFLLKISENSKEELMKELGIEVSMGADFDERDLNPIKQYVDSAKSILKTKNDIENYLEQVMSTYCYNLMTLAGTTVGAKLLSEAGSLKKLATMPSTAIQLLGAEKALFRHLKTGAKPPKYGHIFAHPLVQGAKEGDKGKVSRALADKLAIAVRSDYFSEKYIGEDLRKELEEKWMKK